jgi:hypothetical protein
MEATAFAQGATNFYVADSARPALMERAFPKEFNDEQPFIRTLVWNDSVRSMHNLQLGPQHLQPVRLRNRFPTDTLIAGRSHFSRGEPTY